MPTNTNEYMKEYYLNNKSKWNGQKELIRCDVCDREYKKYNMTAHKKSYKHQRNVDKENESNVLDRIAKLEKILTDKEIIEALDQ